jgi:hypothetical protein
MEVIMNTISITEMKAISKAKGKFYFTPDTVKSLNSRIHTAPNKYGLFVESYDSFDHTYRLYAVKCFAPNTADLETIEPSDIAKTFEHFKTLAKAKDFMHKLTIAFNEACKCYREKAVLTDIAEITEDGFNSGVFTIKNSEGDSIQINTNNFDRFICG